MNKRFCIVIISVMAIILMAGCSSNLEKKITGRWKSQQATVQDGKEYDSAVLKAKEIIFSSDGIVNLNGKPFNYKWIDNEHIQIEDYNEEIFEVTINNKNLLLKHEKSKTNGGYEVLFTKADL